MHKNVSFLKNARHAVKVTNATKDFPLRFTESRHFSEALTPISVISLADLRELGGVEPIWSTYLLSEASELNGSLVLKMCER